MFDSREKSATRAGQRLGGRFTHYASVPSAGPRSYSMTELRMASSGLVGLKQYIKDHRQQDFLDNFQKKLLSYALGRSLTIADDRLLGQMSADLSANDERFQVLVRRIVTSKQFTYRRGEDGFAVSAAASK